MEKNGEVEIVREHRKETVMMRSSGILELLPWIPRECHLRFVVSNTDFIFLQDGPFDCHGKRLYCY